MTLIDAHTHVWLAHAEQDRRDLLDAMDRIPLRRLYTSGLHGHYPTPEEVRAINDAVVPLLRADARAQGQMYLNPRHEAHVPDEFKRCRDLGFAMVKLWQATGATEPCNFPVYELCIAHKMPLLLHCFCPCAGSAPEQATPEEVADVAKRFPELTIVMAHMGGDFLRGVDAIVDCPNVVTDFSGSYGERGMVDYAVQKLGSERILFGSDMPASDLHHNLGKVFGAKLNAEQQADILWRNAERILPWAAPSM